MIIVGYINCNLLNKSTNSAINYRNIFKILDLHILPLHATHRTQNTKTQKNTETWIDHTIVSNTDKVRLHGQTPVPKISNHDSIYLSYNIKTPRYTPRIVKYRD